MNTPSPSTNPMQFSARPKDNYIALGKITISNADIIAKFQQM
jgi:hypothetical protein